jgi:hypothetical protein
MKRIFTIFMFFSIFTIKPAFATVSIDLFTYDSNLVEAQLAEVLTLEAYLFSNEDVTLSILKSEGLFSEQLHLFKNNSFSSFSDAEFPLGIPPFAWGCCLGFSGVAIVYFLTEDKEMTKSALYGCIISSAVFSVFSFAMFIMSLSITTTYTI